MRTPEIGRGASRRTLRRFDWAGPPGEDGGGGAVEAGEVEGIFFVSAGGWGVAPVVIAEDLLQQLGHSWVVFFELLTSVYVVVRRVVPGIAVKPALHTLGEILIVVGDGVGVFPQALVAGGFPVVDDFLVCFGLGVADGDVHDDVGEFVDEDVFATIGIAFEVEEVFLAAGGEGIGARAAQAAGAAVPILLGRKSGVFGRFEVGMLGHIGGEFAGGHDDDANVRFDESIAQVIAVGQHVVDDPCGFLEGVVARLLR